MVSLLYYVVPWLVKNKTETKDTNRLVSGKLPHTYPLYAIIILY